MLEVVEVGEETGEFVSVQFSFSFSGCSLDCFFHICAGFKFSNDVTTSDLRFKR